MIRSTLGSFDIFQFQQFHSDTGIFQFTTTNAQPSGFNLGVYGEDDPVQAFQNRKLLAQLLAIPDDHLIFARQVHGNEVLIIDQSFFCLGDEERKNSLQGVDALISPLAGVCICALAADCSQVLLYDPKKRVIATVHAGWRGTANKLVCKVIEIMKERFGCDPSRIRAATGPCINGKNYEVGEEVAQAFEESFGMSESIILRRNDTSRPHVDITAALVKSMQEAGIPPQFIETSGICTFENAQQFYSARRGATGRFCSGLMMRK